MVFRFMQVDPEWVSHSGASILSHGCVSWGQMDWCSVWAELYRMHIEISSGSCHTVIIWQNCLFFWTWTPLFKTNVCFWVMLSCFRDVLQMPGAVAFSMFFLCLCWQILTNIRINTRTKNTNTRTTRKTKNVRNQSTATGTTAPSLPVVTVCFYSRYIASLWSA